MTEPEFSRTARVDTLGSAPRMLSFGANLEERAALAKRFELVAIDRLSAEAELTRAGDTVRARGTLSAEVTQSCVASGVPVPSQVEEDFEIEFRPQPESGGAEEEIELSEGELDVVFYSGSAVDVGEAVAETLWLSLEPFPRAPEAEDALKEAGVKTEEQAARESSPFAGLAALKDKLGK
nr:DUF177 domain-containing protein [uncultured Sphingosinicella sp.]